MQPNDPPLLVASTDQLCLYPERDHVAQGDYYLRHVDAMTREGLHAKSRIAGELAARDIEIERLRTLLEKIDPKAQAGLCYFTLGSAREFLKDVRDEVAEALGTPAPQR